MFIQKIIIIALSAISTITTQNNTYSINLSHVVSNNKVKTNETSFLSETTNPQINITTNTYEKLAFKVTNYNSIPNNTYITLFNTRQNNLLHTFEISNTEDKTYEHQFSEEEQTQEIPLELRLENNSVLETLNKPAKPTIEPILNITSNTYEKIAFKITNYNLVAKNTYIYLRNAKYNNIIQIFTTSNTEDKTYTYNYTSEEQKEEINLKFELKNGTLLKTLKKPAKPTIEPILNITTNTYEKLAFKVTNYNSIPNNTYITLFNTRQNNLLHTFEISNTEDKTYEHQFSEEEQTQEIPLELRLENNSVLQSLTKPARTTNETPVLTLRTNAYDGFGYTIDNYDYTEKPINLSIYFGNQEQETITINTKEDIYTYSYPKEIYEQATQITIKYNNATILNFTKKAYSKTKLQEPIIEWIDNDIYSRTLMYTVENNNSIQVEYIYLLANGTKATKTIDAKTVENISINYQNTQENIKYGGKFTTNDKNYTESDTIEYTTSIVGYDIEYKRNNNDNVSFYVNILQPISDWTITANNQTYTLEESLTSFNIEGAATEFMLKYKNEVKETFKISLFEEKAGDYVDIPGLILTIITLPFSFISQAFNITLFKGTPYAINVSTMLLTIVGGAILIWLIVKIIKIIKP